MKPCMNSYCIKWEKEEREGMNCGEHFQDEAKYCRLYMSSEHSINKDKILSQKIQNIIADIKDILNDLEDMI